MTTRSRVLALVPARGGSRRIPRKNIVPLGGKPLLAWTVEAALASGVFADVYVSSDDAEILAAGERSGARTLARPMALGSDTATVVEVALDALDALAATAPGFDALYVLLPSSPFRRPGTIVQAWQRFATSDADALLSIVPAAHPPQWALVLEDGYVRPADPAGYAAPRSALSLAYRHDGGHAVASVASLRHRGDFIGARTIGFPIAPEEAIDIDTPLDLAFAEFLVERGHIGGVKR